MPPRGSRSAFLIVLAAMVAATVGGLAPAAGAAQPNAQPPAISGLLTLASVTQDGEKGDGESLRPSISSSGDVVAFISGATNLDVHDHDPNSDVYVKDLVTGELTLATTSDTGVKAIGDSISASLAGNGLTVAFPSNAANLDPGDTDTTEDIYVKDLATGDVTLASTSDTGVKGDEDSFNPSLSKTGARVAFQSSATTLDPGDTTAGIDVYVKKLTFGDIVLVSTSTSGVKGDGGSLFPSIAPLGKRVAFTTSADNLDPADTDTVNDVYVKELKTGTLTLASVSKAGVKGNGPSTKPSLSSTGLKVAFSSEADNLGPSDPNFVSDVYVKDLDTGKVQLASTSDKGVRANGASLFPALSGNGQRVAFVSSATNLDPADTDTGFDMYVKDLVTGDISLVTTSSSGVKGPGETASEPPSISGKGNSVAFDSTATTLDPGDTDDIYDVYVKQPILCTTVGTAGDDILTGTSGDDVMCGRGGDDTIQGLGGDDTLLGEAGFDTLQGGPGADGMDGGADTDLLDYAGSSAGVSVDLAAGTATGGDATGDVFAGSEEVSGSDFPDTLTGDGGLNALVGQDGDDTLAGGGGGDLLLGGDDFDTLDYRTSPAAVTVDLTAGTASGGDADGDGILGFEGVTGSAFDDTLTGDPGDNVFEGMAGADTIDGAGGTDVATYTLSPKAVTVNLLSGNVSGGDAKGDVLTAIANVTGSGFDDKLTGTDDPSVLTGLAGDDTLTGKDGDDTLLGQDGTDTFDGGGGTDTCDNVTGESVTKCEL